MRVPSPPIGPHLKMTGGTVDREDLWSICSSENWRCYLRCMLWGEFSTPRSSPEGFYIPS